MRMLLALAGRTHELVHPETIIGRAAECDIVVHDKSVSRHHAAILLTPSGARVRDLGSRNGTAVNGAMVEGERRLQAGDRLQLGVLEGQVTAVLGEEGDRDDGWLAMQSALLLRHSTAGHTRLADGIVFRIAESFEARGAIGERFGNDVTDAALAAVIDYATLRNRPGWIRWVMGMHAKLGLAPQNAVRRALDGVPGLVDETQQIRTSGTVPKRPSIGPKRQVG
jgi:hypothetical protein